nr:MAG TPA: hypothetical protein [Bacteriophage sp.]
MCCPAATGGTTFTDQQPECTSRASFAYFWPSAGAAFVLPEP